MEITYSSNQAISRYAINGITGCGFTHFHLSRFYGKHPDNFRLVNMPVRHLEGGNGRVYDPVMGRFLSPDNGACPEKRSDIGIQAPENTQNLNRYSYALNNPEYYAFLDSRAYRLELNNSFQNGLSYKQHLWLQQKLIKYSNIAGVSPGNLTNYTFLQWLRSL
ncbi:MAG: hypothetical protein K9I94_02515 [Bacteroidales bacterium]|nr:hypothetical protein [Bacteroidales bacterium]